jgi:hypothetical protein
MFGYMLENFPQGAVRPGPVLSPHAGGLNLHTPACFVFPAANGCVPGSPFWRWQQAEAAAFRAYQPFPFVLPWWQQGANGLTLVTLAGVLGVGVVTVYQSIHHSRSA